MRKILLLVTFFWSFYGYGFKLESAGSVVCMLPQMSNTSFSTSNGADRVFTVPGSEDSFIIDITEVDNSFNLKINGTSLASKELELSPQTYNPANDYLLEFYDGTTYEQGNPAVWDLIGDVDNPTIRLVIKSNGTVSVYGAKATRGQLYPMRIRGGGTFNSFTWNKTSDNVFVLDQRVVGTTFIKGNVKTFTSAQALETCANTPGNAIFNLEAVEPNLIASSTATMHTFEYYTNLADLQAGSNRIPNPSSYQSLSNPQTIYIKINATAGCVGMGIAMTTIEKQQGPTTALITAPTNSLITSPSGILMTTNTDRPGTFQWYRDGILISGATVPTYLATQPGSYTCKVSYGDCYKDSNAFAIVGCGVALDIVEDGTSVFTYSGGVFPTLKVKAANATTTSADVKWYSDDFLYKQVGTGFSYTPAIGSSLAYYAVVSNDCGKKVIKFTITPQDIPVIDNPFVDFLCEDTDVYLIDYSLYRPESGNDWYEYRLTTEINGTVTENTFTTDGPYLIYKRKDNRPMDIFHLFSQRFNPDGTNNGSTGTGFYYTVQFQEPIGIVAKGATTITFCSTDFPTLEVMPKAGFENTTANDVIWYKTYNSGAGTYTDKVHEKSFTYTPVDGSTKYYAVTSNACGSTVVEFTLTQSIVTFTTAQTDLSCNGALDGAVTITTSGGTAPYAYYVDDVLKASNVVTGLTGGNHTIKVKDASGCESSVQTINLTEPAALTSSAVVDQHVSINGGTDGELTVRAGGGVAPYEYSLDGTTFQASATFSGLGAGMYTITTRDANGCETTTSVTIIEPGSLVLSAVIDQAILCNGDANGQLTATVTGGVAPYEYSLDGTTFQASGTFSGLIAGTYTVTVKDANGAVGTTALTLTEPAALTSSAVVDQHVSINGGTDGELTVTAGGGVAPYEYSLDGTTFQASATFSGLGAGMYTITTRDANGCETTTSVTIIEPGSLVLSAVIDQAILCNGDANGQLTATVTGGVAPYEYSLDGTTFQASGTFSGLIAGTYTVTVKDANGAVGTTALTLTEPAALTSSAVVDQHVSINGGTDGELTVTAGGGVAPYEYSLDGTTFQASATFSGLGAGMYTITTRDANGCETTTSVTIIEPGSLVLSAVIDQAILCNGDANGQLTATVTGGVAPYEYSLDGTTFQASGTFSGLIAGTYTVTVKDANGAVGTTALTLTEPAALTSSAVVDQHVSINGGTDGELTVTAGGGVAPYEYSLDGTTFQASATFSGLGAGMYTITTRDANGCETTTSVTIIEPGSLVLSAVIDQAILCNGDANGQLTATVTGGVAPYEYSLDGTTFQASGTFSGLIAGTYTVTVKDANGAVGTTALTLTEPAALTSSAVVDQHVSINGGTDGELTVTAGGGVAPYEYSLDGTTFQASATFSGLGAGMYTITTRDANGCETTTSVTIIEPGSLVLSAVIDQAILCNGDANGQLTATVTGGVAPYEYSLDGTTFQASGTFSGLIAGTYTVTVKDANGAVGTTALTLTEPAALTSSAVVDQHVSINGGTDGELTVTAGGGVAPYEYSLDGTTFQASATFSGLGAGMYTITTRDANGCETTTSVTIIEPGSLVLSAVIDQAILCNGDANGQLTATVTGGVAPYEYSLDGTTFQASGTFSGLIAGTYTVTVKDANGAVGTTALTLTEPAALTSSAVVDQHVSINGGTDGELTVTAGGGVAPYEYSLDGTTFQASATFSGLGAGMYTITTRDANGCETTTSVTIIEPGSLVLSAVIDQAILCNGDANGQLTATVTGGVAPYEYSLDGTTFQASGTFSGLIAGTYTVTVKDANGAVGTTALTLTEPAALTSSAVVDQHVSINGGTDGELTVTAGGGVAPYEYSLDGTTFQASATFSGLGAGMYTITTRDANGCETTTSVTIIEPGSLVLSAVIDQAILCNGDANGQLTATVTGGVAPYEYSLDGTTFQASGTFSGLIAGTYTVTVKDANGAVGTTALTLTEPAVVSFTTRVTPTSCNGMNDGQLTVTTSGGTSPYEYSLDGTTFQASATFSGLVAGMYTITTRDANGCTTASQEETLTEPLALSLPVVDTLVEYCAEDVAPVLTATNSNPSISFNWYDAGGSLLGSGSNLDLAGLGLGAGTYYVESTSNSCTSTQVMLEVVAMVTPIPEIQEMNGNILNDQLYGTFEGDDVALQVTPIDPNLAIVWTTVGGTNATTATLDIMNISGADAGDYTVSYTQSIGMSGFCEATAKTTLVVLQTAEEALGEDIYKCEEASVTFSYPDDARLGLTYSWTGPDGFSSSDSSITVSTSGNYNLQVTTKEGLVSEGEVYLAVSDLAVTVSESCYGQVILQPQGGVGPYEYSLNGGAWQASPIFKEVSQGTNVYQVRDAKFCEESITHTDQAFTLRQAFSPNGDGINEYWDLTSLSGCSRMEVNIFDRYGRLLHQLNASNPTWDGASKGKHQPSGTYWFVIDFKDSNTPTLKSHVTIKRTQE